jgi:dTDP-4-dehydrorhamnose reductase
LSGQLAEVELVWRCGRVTVEPGGGSQLERVVVLGGSGLVGSTVRQLWRGELDVVAPTHAELDVLDAERVAAFLSESGAQAVLNLAAGAQVDAAEGERGDRQGLVYALNADAPGRLATICKHLDVHLVHISTDYVFDGTQAERAYREDDPPNPLGWYGETKLIGEQRVLQQHPGACVARIEMPFTARPHARSDFARTCLRRLEHGESIAGVTDQRITPVLLDDAVRALRVLVAQRFTGLIHVAASDWTTPFDYARAIADRLNLDRAQVRPTTFEAFATTRAARRPQHSWLDVSRFAAVCGRGILRTFEEELSDWLSQLQRTVTSQARA